MVSDVQLNQSVQTQTQQDQSQLISDFDEFLLLLTTQLENQDPTEPLSTEEFTNQLVQFSQVEQQIATNSKLDELISLQLTDPLSGASSFVGMIASYEGSEFYFDGENPSEMSYSLNNPSVDTQIIIRDEFGTEIYRESGRTGAGSHDFIWDGLDNNGDPVEPGTYNVTIDAIDADGNQVFNATLVKGEVRGIETDGLNTFLLIGERAVPQSQVLRLEQPSQNIDQDQDQATIGDDSDASSETDETQEGASEDPQDETADAGDNDESGESDNENSETPDDSTPS